jgi:hypothetical protein
VYILVGIVCFKKKKLGDYQIGGMIFNFTPKKNDSFFQES